MDECERAKKGESAAERGEQPGRRCNWPSPALSALHLPAGEIQERRAEAPLQGIPLTVYVWVCGCVCVRP